MHFILGERSITIEDVAAASQGGTNVTLTQAARERLQLARRTLDDFLLRDIPVYGLNTGMGANTGYRMSSTEAAAIQKSLVLPRVAGVGPPLSLETCRAVLFSRLVGLAQGGAGVSLAVFDLLASMLALDAIPIIPAYGSIGASDLTQTMSLAAAAIGEGPVYFAGEVIHAGEALARVGLAPATLEPKDGLSIGSASSVSTACAALVLCSLDDLIAVHIAAAALACQGFGASPNLFDGRVAAARQAAGQVDAAARFRNALRGSSYFDRPARSVQDAISFRALAQVTGAVIASFDNARRETEVELNAAAENPIILPGDSEILPSANFLTNSLALAFDTASIALVHLASASVQRSFKLMSERHSGLPNYLSPRGGASAGFVPMQKTLAALQAAIRLKAAPASLDAIVVSDMVEDIGPNTTLAIGKVAEQAELARRIVSIEAMLAAQAVDLRRRIETGLRLGPATAALYEGIRDALPSLDEDRATGADADAVNNAIWTRDMVSLLRQSGGEVG